MALNLADYRGGKLPRLTFTRLVLIFVCYAVPITIFAKIATEVREREIIRGDARVLLWLHSIATPLLDQLALVATVLGEPIGVAAAAIAVAALFAYRQRRRAAILMLFGVGGSELINMMVKLLLHRPRPDLWTPLVTESGYSFPSGHAMASSALAFSLIVLFWPTRWRWTVGVVGLTYIVLVGLSRLYLGVHFPSDILAGWCVSFVWILIVRAVVSRAGK